MRKKLEAGILVPIELRESEADFCVKPPVFTDDVVGLCRRRRRSLPPTPPDFAADVFAAKASALLPCFINQLLNRLIPFSCEDMFVTTFVNELFRSNARDSSVGACK